MTHFGTLVGKLELLGILLIKGNFAVFQMIPCPLLNHNS